VLGDVFLIRSVGTAALLNLTLQWLLTRRSGPGYTHVALGTGRHQVIHAMPAPAHVEFAMVHELLAPDARWEAFRHRELAARLEKDATLALNYHDRLCGSIGEAYNMAFILRDADHSSFCSQLVGKLLADFGCPFPVKPHRLMPMQIAHEVRKSREWQDVCAEYRELLRQDDDFQRLHHNPNERDARAHLAAYLYAKARANWDELQWTAAVKGPLPESNVTLVERDGITVVRQVDPVGGVGEIELPETCREGVDRWGLLFTSLTDRLAGADWIDMLTAAMPPRSTGSVRALVEPGTARHDAALVLGREDLAKAAALYFDGVLPVATDCVPPEALAWKAPAAWRMAGADLHETAYVLNKARMRERIIQALEAQRLKGSYIVLSPAALMQAAARADDLSVTIAMPAVELETASWEMIVELRKDDKALRQLRLPRTVLAGSFPDDERPALLGRLHAAREAQAAAARKFGFALRPGEITMVVSTASDLARTRHSIPAMLFGASLASVAASAARPASCTEAGLSLSVATAVHAFSAFEHWHRAAFLFQQPHSEDDANGTPRDGPDATPLTPDPP